MEHFGLTQRLMLTALLGGALGTGAATIWWFAARTRLRTLKPGLRLRRLVSLAAMPVVGALGLVGIVVLPSILHAVGLIADHCGAHPSHHVHLCLLHTDHAHASPLAWLAIGGVAMWFGLRARPVVSEWIRAKRKLSVLKADSEPDGNGETKVVASQTPFAATVGLFAPRVLVSEALRSALSEAQYEVVTTHERVHADRFHTLLQAGVDFVGLLHLPPVRTFLDREVALACEQVADLESARQVGGALEVADTILTVERLLRDAEPLTSMRPSIDGGNLEQRVRGLLDEPWRRSARYTTVAGVAVATLLVAGSYNTVHHGLETFFSVVF